MNNANLFCIIIIIILSGGIAWKRLRDRNVSSLFYASYFAVFGIAQIIGFSLDTDSSYPLEIRLKANIVNIIILICLFIGEIIILKIYKKRRNISYKKDFLLKEKIYFDLLLWVTFIASLIGFFIIIQYRGESNIGRWLFSLIIILNYISILKKKWIILGIGIILILAVITVASARSFLFYIIGPIVYYYITEGIKKKINIRKALLFVVCIPIFFILFESVHLWRWQAERTAAVFSSYVFDKNTYYFLLSNPSSEFNYRFYYFRAIELFPRYHDWLYGNTYKNILLFWLPSQLSEGIKIDTIYKYADAFMGESNSYEERASIQPTYSGDCYINFGYLFWLPALLWGIGFSLVHIKAKKNIIWNILAGSSFVYFLALSFRGSIYLAFFQIIISAIFLIIMYIISRVPLRFSNR